jgi:hypothetical protein
MRAVDATFGLVDVVIRIDGTRRERIGVIRIDHAFIRVEIGIEVRSENCGTTRRARGKPTCRRFLHASFRLRTPSSIRSNLVLGMIAIPKALECLYIEALVTDSARTNIIKMPRIAGSEPLEAFVRQNGFPGAVLLNIERQTRFMIRAPRLGGKRDATTAALVPTIKHVLLRNRPQRRIERHRFARILFERRGKPIPSRLFDIREDRRTNGQIAMRANGDESIRIDTSRFGNDLLRQTFYARRRTARTRCIKNSCPSYAFIDRIDRLGRLGQFRIGRKFRRFCHTARQKRSRRNGKGKANRENGGGRGLHASQAMQEECPSIRQLFNGKT